MSLHLLATLVASLHGLIVVCLVAGAVAAMAGLLRRRPRLEAAFYLLMASLIASDLLLGECFLTGLEQRLLNLHHPGFAYRGSFIGHHFPWLPRPLHIYGGPALIAGALLAYPFWRWRGRRRTERKKTA